MIFSSARRAPQFQRAPGVGSTPALRFEGKLFAASVSFETERRLIRVYVTHTWLLSETCDLLIVNLLSVSLTLSRQSAGVCDWKVRVGVFALVDEETCRSFLSLLE